MEVLARPVVGLPDGSESLELWKAMVPHRASQNQTPCGFTMAFKRINRIRLKDPLAARDIEKRPIPGLKSRGSACGGTHRAMTLFLEGLG
jgi:hypothetical protein